jgi:hypothetical protein
MVEMKKELDPYKNLDDRKKYYNKTETKKAAKDSHLKRTYGISLKDYNHKLVEQKHCCYICGIDELSVKKGLVVDHNHNTGDVRGLLCGKCNSGLGFFNDKEELLLQAAEYLKKFKK